MAFVLGLLASCGAESAALAPTGAAGGSAAGAAGATSVRFGGVGPGDIDASPDAAGGTGGSSGSEAGVATQVDGGDGDGSDGGDNGGEAGRTCDDVRSDFLAVLASSGSAHCATTWECNAGPADSAYHPWPSRPLHRTRARTPRTMGDTAVFAVGLIAC